MSPLYLPWLGNLALVFLLWMKLTISENTTQPVNSITNRMNFDLNVTRTNKSSVDITILSDQYFFCVWSIAKENIGNPSTEIYSNVFSFSNRGAISKTDYLLNRIKGYSQDKPSATTLFNTSNHATQRVAVVWASKIIVDRVFGRIIQWSITYSNGVKVTSPTSNEFEISNSYTGQLHHTSAEVIPIYKTDKFVVSWISQSKDNIQNMIFIRIYYNSGRPYSGPIQLHGTDVYLKKYLHPTPLAHNVTLMTWLSQSMTDDDSNLMVYGMVHVIGQNGDNKLMTNDTCTFLTTPYRDTVPAIAHLHDNYFVLAWSYVLRESNTWQAAVYLYDEDTNQITQISEIYTPLFEEGYVSDQFKIRNLVLENIVNDLYDPELALCYSLRDFENDKSDVFCRIVQISLRHSGDRVSANISVITQDTMINIVSQKHHQHEEPVLSATFVSGAQSTFTDTPKFLLGWSDHDSREGRNDVYVCLLEVTAVGDSNDTSVGRTVIPTRPYSTFASVSSAVSTEVVADAVNQTFIETRNDSHQSNSHVIAIVLSMIGLFVFIGFILIVIFCYHRKQKKHDDDMRYTTEFAEIPQPTIKSIT
eukprot:415075_1